MSGNCIFEDFVNQYDVEFYNIGWQWFELDIDSDGNKMVRFDICSKYPGPLAKRFYLDEDAAVCFYNFSQAMRELQERLNSAPDFYADRIYYDLVVSDKPVYGLPDDLSMHDLLLKEGYSEVSSPYGSFRFSDRGEEIYQEIRNEMSRLVEKFPYYWDCFIDFRESFCELYNVSFSDLIDRLEPSLMDEYKRYFDNGWLD